MILSSANRGARFGVVLLFGLLLAPTASASSAGQPAAPDSGLALTEAEGILGPDIRTVASNGRIAVEELRGGAAKAHLDNLRSRRPAAFAAATAALRRRGFVPTEIVFVERTVRLASGNVGHQGAVGFASYTESNSEGEITLWSWDDGDDTTWEGSIYVEKYGGESAIAEGQLDISTENWWWYYTEVAWESGPVHEENQDVRLDPSTRSAPIQHPVTAGIMTASNRLPPTMYMFAQGGARDWIQFFKDYRSCVVAWCAAAAVACIATGAAWPLCWGFSCLGAQLGCFLDNWW